MSSMKPGLIPTTKMGKEQVISHRNLLNRGDLETYNQVRFVNHFKNQSLEIPKPPISMDISKKLI